MAAIDAHATIEELLEAVFSAQSVPRLYNEKQLRLRRNFQSSDGRRVEGWCEMVASLQEREPGNRGTSAGEHTAD
jgi:hypothetical protein